MILSSLTKLLISRKYAIIWVISIGILLRCIYFPNVPPGINQDEASAAYEAYSLLLTGKDRWGNPFPIYFPGWGSGQNVLYSYLTIPAIAIFGLNIFSARIVNVVFGILTLPLMYVCVKSIFNTRIAFYSTLLLAILPWHIMMSRWGLESNLLPFFLLLGTYSIHQSIFRKNLRGVIVFSLLPWALSLYAYAVSIFIIPPFMILIFYLCKERILKRQWEWTFSLIIFILISMPLFLFLIKNQVIKSNFGFERFLPISIPLLPYQRSQEASRAIGQNLQDNIRFILNGFDDRLIWNTPPFFLPLFMATFPFLWIGILVLIRKFRGGYYNFFLLWLMATIPILFLVKLNINRGNAIFIPIIVLSVFGFQKIKYSLKSQYMCKILNLIVAIWISINSILFTLDYFSVYPKMVSTEFQVGLENAINTAIEIAEPEEKILLTKDIPLNYIYVLFFKQIDPNSFQKNVVYSFQKDSYRVEEYGRFYFDYQYLPQKPGNSFIYIQRINENKTCKVLMTKRMDDWMVNRCLK
jgi:4-amino-4-deoxy-L-arabinose transferase-like glycosyltransferase